MVRSQPDLLVVFVGNDTSEWAAGLKRRINEASLADHVRFVGRRADPYAFIRAADLLIHPSRTEGQGLVLLEATLLRTPVLASDVGGIPSVITHGDTGWLVPPDDPAALLRGFEHLVANPRLRRELTDRAEQSYWRRCSQREYSAALTLVLQAFLAPGGAQGAR
jgi:glycosyltransferase involved in cell wall biosynthesis